MINKPLVLVVEDEDVLRFLAQKQLSLVGLDSHVATNGRDAVAMAIHGYAMIFMDLSMPEMNGLEATSHIREQELKEGKTRTPIIGVTAFRERDKCIGAGMDDFIQKPMLLDQVRAVTKKFLTP